MIFFNLDIKMMKIKLFSFGLFIYALILINSVAALTCLKGLDVDSHYRRRFNKDIAFENNPYFKRYQKHNLDAEVCLHHFAKSSCIRIEFVGRLDNYVDEFSGNSILVLACCL